MLPVGLVSSALVRSMPSRRIDADSRGNARARTMQPTYQVLPEVRKAAGHLKSVLGERGKPQARSETKASFGSGVGFLIFSLRAVARMAGTTAKFLNKNSSPFSTRGTIADPDKNIWRLRARCVARGRMQATLIRRACLAGLRCEPVQCFSIARKPVRFAVERQFSRKDVAGGCVPWNGECPG